MFMCVYCLRKNIIGHFGQQIFFYGIKSKKFPSVVQGTNGTWNIPGTFVPGNECSLEWMI